MKEENHVMNPRKVYNKGHKPIIVVLIPEVKDEVRSLTMIQRAFSNDINKFSFPKLRN